MTMAKDDLKVVRIFPAEVSADLARSGLNADDGRLMRLEPKDSEWADENLGIPRAGYVIPYFDSEGGRIDEMYRFRFTEFTPARTFGGKTVEIDQIKYTQPAGTRPYAYFSRRIEWGKALAEKERRIIFTEGEKKAEAACKAGMLCIGLGGVYAFRSASREWFFLPELDAIDWKDRLVDICYDSDVMVKKEVYAALTALTEQLVKRGATVSFIFLEPEGDNDKIGLDDFLVLHGAKAFYALDRQQSKLSEAFNILNSQAAFLETLGVYWSFEHRVQMGEQHARTMLSPKATLVIPPTKNAAAREIPAFEKWMHHKFRRTLRTIVYAPGNVRSITVDGDVNLWQAPKLKPKRGAVGPWLDLVKYIFREQEYVDWFLQWLAYPLQVPGTKHYTAVFVCGEKQGSGKSFILTPLGRLIYGDNFCNLTNEMLSSTFNGEEANKQLIQIDEIYVPGKDERRVGVMSKLKDMITRERNSINEKHDKRYTVTDHINYYITSNHPDALPLDPEDRRFFVIRAPEEKKDAGFYHELDTQFQTGPIAQHILHYLLNKVDISKFNPKAPALHTEYRAEIIQGAFDFLDEFADRVATNPDEIINRRDITRVLCTAADLLDTYYLRYPRASQTTVIAMGRALGRYKTLPRREVRTDQNSPKYNLYALFERGTWDKKSNKDWAAYHDETLRMRRG
jgi:hypothetical protein